MTVPNVFISRRPRTVRDWLSLAVAYRLPIAILVVSSTIIIFFVAFLLHAYSRGTALRQSLQAVMASQQFSSAAAATVFVEAGRQIDWEVRKFIMAVSCSAIPCCALYVLLYWSFYRAVFTAPGFVDVDGMWQGQPQVDPHTQSQIYGNWVSAQQVLAEAHQQRAAFVAHQRAWRAYQHGRFHTVPVVPETAKLSSSLMTVSSEDTGHVAPRVAPEEVTPCAPIRQDHAREPEEASHSPAPIGCDPITHKDAPPSPFAGHRPSTMPAALAGVTTAIDTLSTSLQPPAHVHNTHAVSEYEVNGAARCCLHCQLYKPDHGHHCRFCGRCVFYMDHHCTFLNTCVGLRNYKFFILLLFYTLCCGFGNGLWVAWLMTRARDLCTHFRHLSIQHEPFTRIVTAARPGQTPVSLAFHLRVFRAALGSTWWLCVPIAMWLIAVVVAYLLAYHVELCWRGESTLERKTSASIEALMRLTDQAHGTNKYHRGGCGASCCLCDMARALWGCLTRRLRRDTNTSEEPTEDAMSVRRHAHFGMLFGRGQAWWFHLLPRLPAHLDDADWLARQGIDAPSTPFFHPPDVTHKSA